MRDAAIFLYDRTGVMASPWSEAGIECWCIDIQNSIRATRRQGYDRRDGNTYHAWGDGRSWCPPAGVRVVFVAVFSPCTDLAVSGAQDFKAKGIPMLCDGLGLFHYGCHAAAWSGAPYCAENPVGVISTHHRPPDHTFDPCDYAGYLADPSREAYTKKTCLWTGNGFVMPTPRRVEPVKGSMMHKLPPSDDRADLRSVTPEGFARAVFAANWKGARDAAA
jgi:hypothetical protein